VQLFEIIESLMIDSTLGEKNVPELFLKHRKNIETEQNQSWSLYMRFKSPHIEILHFYPEDG